MSKSIKLEVLSKDTAAALDLHASRLRSYLMGQRKATAECFGYAYLFGREALAAKAVIPHGNSGDANRGFQSWIQDIFPQLSYRTVVNWMRFAEAIMSKSNILPPLQKRELLLSDGKLSKIRKRDRSTILEIVPLILDGKGMMEFTRASGLLRDPQKQKHHPRKPVDPAEIVASQKKQADEFWERIGTQLEIGKAIAPRRDTADLQATLDALIDSSNFHRALLKQRKGTKP